MRVLIVDDMPANRHVLTALLKRIGHVVSAAGSVEEAVQRFLDERPDAILTDFHLGDGANGLELAMRLRGMPGGDSVRIGLMTGDARDSVENDGCLDAVLEKPVGLDEIKSFLEGLTR